MKTTIITSTATTAKTSPLTTMKTSTTQITATETSRTTAMTKDTTVITPAISTKRMGALLLNGDSSLQVHILQHALLQNSKITHERFAMCHIASEAPS
jgi:hypothetical protein